MEGVCPCRPASGEPRKKTGQQKDVRRQSDRLVVARRAKFMDPVTGKTWTGQGRRPKWLEGREDAYRIGGF
ncbi:H-NS family nucleoid-associated regulatory protein [Ralstonia sp. 25mfcol4.1]|uniref:H-NS family nucleoid-associated regulatory protein n=1 Tax=Burkholderiaceae TaxID=119060 RepID=UPI0020C905E2|nr:H-NS family nucleoid-associated regulatory protein [Ralstonia sp. 25mfcol4.1]